MKCNLDNWNFSVYFCKQFHLMGHVASSVHEPETIFWKKVNKLMRGHQWTPLFKSISTLIRNFKPYQEL